MNSRDTLDTQLNVLESFNPVVPEFLSKLRVLNVRKPNTKYSAKSFRPTAKSVLS